MNIDKHIFFFQVGTGKVEEEGAEGEVNPWSIGIVEKTEEGLIILNLSFILVVLLHVSRIGLQKLIAYFL